MRAVMCREAGGVDVLEFCDCPTPVPGPGEVLVRVAATAVNRADLLQRQGHYPPPPGASDVLGLECSGVVAELGDGVEGFAVGDRVCALLTAGGYAEYVAVPQGQVLPVPEGMSLSEAAAVPEVACTAWSNLVQTAGLTSGQWALIHGGAGGVGSMAIQVARLVGAHCAVTAGSAEKLAFCEQLGAEVLINYRDEDFVARVTQDVPGGVDVVLDNMGAKYLAQNMKTLRRGGTLVVIGLQGGVHGEIHLGALVSRRLTVVGTTLRARSVADKAAVVAGVRETLWPAVAAGAVRPIIDSALDWQDVQVAHGRVEAYEHIGKVVLHVDSELAEDA